MFRLGQPLHQIVTVLLVALVVAASFLFGAIANEEPLEVGGEIWASATVMNIAFALGGLLSFVIAFPLLMALRARLSGRQYVRLDTRRVVLEGLNWKGIQQFQYGDIEKAELASMGRHQFVLVRHKDGKRMTIPLLVFNDENDPAKLVAHISSRMANG